MSPFMRKTRICRVFEGAMYFKPTGVPLSSLEANTLELDELEAIHLCDYEGLHQSEASEKMNISTSTLQRLLYSGRKKIIDALYNSKAIKITKHDQVLEQLLPTTSGYGRRRKRCGQRGNINREITREKKQED